MCVCVICVKKERESSCWFEGFLYVFCLLQLSSQSKRRIPELIKELDHLLTEGVITEDYVLGKEKFREKEREKELEFMRRLTPPLFFKITLKSV